MNDLIFEVERLLLAGKTLDIIIAGLAEGHSEEEVRAAHDSCLVRWMAEAKTEDPVFARQLRTLRHLYDKSFKLNDFKACLAVHKQIQDLQGRPAAGNRSVASRINRENLRKINQSELAALLGRDIKTVQRWHEDGLPREGEGKALRYDWYRVEAWRDEKRTGANNLDDRARKLRGEADILEMEAAERAGTLVSVAAVTQEYTDFLTRLRSNLMGFGDRLIPLLAETTNPREHLAIARREMGVTLREVSEQVGTDEE